MSRAKCIRVKPLSLPAILLCLALYGLLLIDKHDQAVKIGREYVRNHLVPDASVAVLP
ncbi:MAG: hypothetical protein IPI97_07630 [Nitrosomonas sp.]|nr:hypothetical protein [Nitrosomonas sp.]MBK7364860.1 hypothetical protein [Nitrosomonas sp.]